MKLTEQQIEQLYQFTRKHYVEWYDLQTELVDHLANGIEQQWETNANISFEDALQKEFKKFGVFGFMTVVEQRQNALSKKYWKIMWSFVKEWFKLPKIITTITFVFGVFLALKSSFGLYVYYGTIILATIFISIKTYKLTKAFNTKKKQTGRKWMFEEMIYKTAAGNGFIFFVNLYNIHQFSDLTAEWYIWLLTITLTIVLLLSYVALDIIPKNAKRYLEDMYPEYNFV